MITDRELDAVIAEKVYGRTLHRVTDDIIWQIGIGTRQMVPYYSSSLDALAPVVTKTIEKVGADDWLGRLSLVVTGSYDDRGHWCSDDLAKMWTASPRQIAEAVVRCWE